MIAAWLILRSCGKYEGLDHDRHGTGRWNECADINVIEVAEPDAVNGNNCHLQLQFFSEVQSDDAADIAVIDQDEWMAFGENLF